jgi:hypothetical protein
VGSTNKRYVEKGIRPQKNEEVGIWRMYLFALKSPLTREKYQKRLEKFFDFKGLEGKP